MSKKATMFFLLNSLDIHRGGVTKSSMMQANLFAEQGYDTYLVTFNFNSRYAKIIKELIELGKLDNRVKFLNLYQDLGGTNEEKLTPKEIETLLKINEKNDILDPHIGHNSYRVYSNGLYTKYLRYDKTNNIEFIDYFSEQRYRTKREDYDEFGYLRKVSYMDFVNNKARQMIFYRDNGKAYLSKWVNPDNGLANRVNYFNVNGELERIFPNDVELKTYWLETIISKYEYPVVVSDARAVDPIMLNLKNNQVYKIWRLHSNHVGSPYDPNGDIEKTIKPCIDGLDKLDAVLVLTEEQKTDLEKRFGKRENIKVLPHYMEHFTDTGWFDKNEKDENLAIVVSRFAKLKRIDHIISAFSKVVDKFPEAKLELWGYGEEENNLKKFINEKKLTNNIKIKGFTHNPDRLYNKALFSVLASKTEGFSLGILESMANGTPVISYDIKYGPHDMITDNKTGLFAENGNVEQLAEKMIWMFENRKHALKMGKKAAKSVKERYNKEVYKERWLQIVSQRFEAQIINK
jgi:glycosyltransferase involved in cell wall biosynthesis